MSVHPELADIKKQQLLLSLGMSQDMLEGAIDDIVDFLVEKVDEWNEAYYSGVPSVSDNVYDTVRQIIDSINPELDIMSRTYSKDESELHEEYDKFLVNRMLSIKTIKEKRDLEQFISTLRATNNGQGVRCHASLKINGHGVRVVLKHGDVVRATTRGRGKAGRDITRQMQVIIGHKPELESISLIEIRGEVALSKENWNKVRAMNPSIKSVFSAVASLIRPSASEEELQLLDFIAYNQFSDDIKFRSKSDTYYFLRDAGFEVPHFIGNGLNLTGIDPDGEESEIIIGPNFMSDIEEVVEYFGQYKDTYKYDTDGVVLTIDDNEQFTRAGNREGYALGNVALKMGKWQQLVYFATIEEIVLKPGKTKKTPVAKIEPTLTSNGNTVRNVPLYNLATVMMLGAYEGSTIAFKYGGEAGVVPCLPSGEPINMIDEDVANAFTIPILGDVNYDDDEIDEEYEEFDSDYDEDDYENDYDSETVEDYEIEEE